jgi:alkylation response protein AidB-like acyl-CoA dehydrogenase
MAVVMEEAGRSVADVPLLTSVIAVALLDAVGSDLLGEVVSGGRTAAVAMPWNRPLTAERSRRVEWVDGAVTGVVQLVAGVEHADIILVPVPGAVLAVDVSDVEVAPVTALDMTRQLSDVTFRASAGTVLATGKAADGALDRAGVVGQAMLTAEQVGLARRSVDFAVEYAKERRQFGRQIGSFQANKHRLADAWVEVQKATAASRHVVATLADSADTAEQAIAAGFSSMICSRAAEQAAGELLQIHGGLGFTWDNPSHLYVKRARVDALALGSPSWHRKRLGYLLEISSAPILTSIGAHHVRA